MEQKKSNKALIILVIVFGIIILGLSTFIVYDKVIKEKDDRTIEENGNDKQDVADNKEENKKEELTADEKFKIYADNVKAEMNKKYNDDDYAYDFVSETSLFYDIALKSNGDLYIKRYGDGRNIEYENYKVASNVINFAITESGNGGCHYLAFVTDDGILSIAGLECSDKNNKFAVRKTDFKNIVTIMKGIKGANSSGVAQTIYIDIDGNMYF